MTRTLLKNAHYISHESGHPEVRAGHIAIEGDKIAAIVPWSPSWLRRIFTENSRGAGI